jgi:hypothetical protein
MRPFPLKGAGTNLSYLLTNYYMLFLYSYSLRRSLNSFDRIASYWATLIVAIYLLSAGSCT